MTDPLRFVSMPSFYFFPYLLYIRLLRCVFLFFIKCLSWQVKRAKLMGSLLCPLYILDGRNRVEYMRRKKKEEKPCSSAWRCSNRKETHAVCCLCDFLNRCRFLLICNKLALGVFFLYFLFLPDENASDLGGFRVFLFFFSSWKLSFIV